MIKFKVGDVVEVVKLTLDAHVAVEVGSTYVIHSVDGPAAQPYLLGGTRFSDWFVAAECLAPISLENE